VKNDIELSQRIMQSATALFAKHGYAKVTTGEIATALGISKKTLYKYFPSKEELYRKTALMHLDEVKAKFDALLANDKLPFIEKLTSSMQFVMRKLMEVGAFLKENSGLLPRVQDRLLRLRQEIVIGFYRKLFREGVRHGHINKKINETIFILILITVLENIFVPKMLAALPFSLLELFTTTARTLLEGVLSDEAKKIFASSRVTFDSTEEAYWNA
jgi:AcrR family transcriptional regulator